VLLSTLFIPKTREPLKKKEQQEIGKLTKTVLERVLDKINNGNLACFDAHVGDYGCERYALAVYKLATDPMIKEECKRLSSKKEEVSGCTNISKDLAFLLQCYLLRSVRETVENETGVEEFACKPQKIKTSIGIDLNKALSERIVYLCQTRISKESVERVKKEAECLATLDNPLKGRIIEVLSPPYVKEASLLAGKVTRCFSDTYYTQKAVILSLRELQVPILIKKMVKVGERPCGSLVIPKAKDGPYIPVNKSDLAPNTPLVVLEGDFRKDLSPADVRKKFLQYGLEDVIFSTCAQVSKDLQDKDPEVQAALTKADLLECLETNNPFFKLDHVFSSTLAEESQEGDIV
jgi:hypothetical protein